MRLQTQTLSQFESAFTESPQYWQ